MKSVKMLSEELGVSKQTIFNNIKRLNIETIKQENTSFIKEDTDIEKIIQRVNENKKKYGFESATEDKQKKESDNINVESKSDTQIVEILKNQIDTLNDQIEKQESRHETTIEFYRKELQERSKLLENQQVLALESNKKIQKLENQLEEERHLNYSFDTSTNNRQNVDAQETTYTTDPVNINQHQEETKEAEIQYKDISESQSDESTQDEEEQREDVPSNQNDNDSDIEEKSEETEPKKGFWSRLFGN
ncbi:DUF536 domain-containing protein [Staphylococcus saprophyticus]|uniref:DUF536 domain-containing protein n=2 Tax=Staphylococcus succinus TaxID=61015 RepID=A0ABX5ILF4_9STAP|nr:MULTISPECIES: DUF536 domain-containing protein [Staphylococcus]MDK9844733.1 DUF536 domain-containing protein [Staphylococcus equorum]MDK9858728.1 DUF536 domain-containing protein [Staphylococcus equorum]MDK9864219.1 DUF536 domain-containing protein [Staphylococcus equorum]MDK9870183.1 DUF536 domain-containing protein [Staphylococcus equorum]MDK9875788.1 DUF536 domain-containing protein [Staphylococcus equorum]